MIIKNSSIKSFFSFTNWKLYLVTYLLYLSHPASTVRQGSSVLFKELLSKNQLSYVFQLMLQSLAVDWSLENFPEIQEAFSKVRKFL